MGIENGSPSSIPIVQRWMASLLVAAYGRCSEDQEDRVDEDTKDGGKDDGGNSTREQEQNFEGEQSVCEGKVAADATNEDDRADCELLRVEEIDLLRLDECHALHADHAEEINAQAANDRCRHGVDQSYKFAEEAKDDSHTASRHENGSRVVACDRHERVVFAVVRASATTEEANYEVVRTISDEVETDEFLDVEWLAPEFVSEFVNVEAHLVEMSSGFGHCGDEDERHA